MMSVDLSRRILEITNLKSIPQHPLVRFAPGNMGDLNPGAKIFIVAGQKMTDGMITAPAINIDRDGVAPPM